MASFLQLCESQPTRDYAPGDVIMEENLKDGRFYVLVSGEVEVRRRGTEVTRISSPGAIFGEVSLLLSVPHTATVVAFSECRFHIIEDGEFFLAEHPELNQQIARLLARRLKLVTDELVEVRELLEASDDEMGSLGGTLRNMAAHPWSH